MTVREDLKEGIWQMFAYTRMTATNTANIRACDASEKIARTQTVAPFEWWLQITVIWFTAVCLGSCGMVPKSRISVKTNVALSSMTAISPPVAQAREVITVTGAHLRSDMPYEACFMSANGEIIKVPVSVADSTLASFIIPGGLGLGEKNFDMILGSRTIATFTVVIDDTSNILGIFTGDGGRICSTDRFIDKTGSIKHGTKDCAPANMVNCSSAGEQSCVASGAYFAGVVCSADESACYLPTYTPGTQDKKAIDYGTIDGSKMLSTLTVSGVLGTIASRTTWDLATSFPGAGYYTGVSNAPSAAAIVLNSTIIGVAGSATASPNNCSADGEAGCVTTASYKSALMTSVLAGNIKSGVTIAGVVGGYPSTTYLLQGAGSTADLENTNFDAQVKSAALFEYWNSAGVRQVSAGDADITAANIADGVSVFGLSGSLTTTLVTPDAWDVRVGTTINNVVGKLKVTCRNRVNSAVYNYDGAVGSIPDRETTAGSTIDYWDTIEDYNNGAAGLPPSVVSGWTNNDCGGIEGSVNDVNIWKDITTTDGTTQSTCATTAAACTMKDKITRLEWSKLRGTSRTWPQAINDCDALTFNGKTDWRLPTQKELMEASTHGVRSAASTNWITATNIGGDFWSGSSVSNATRNAWTVNLGTGASSGGTEKSQPAARVVCVR